jgi:hypothetical protein
MIGWGRLRRRQRVAWEWVARDVARLEGDQGGSGTACVASGRTGRERRQSKDWGQRGGTYNESSLVESASHPPRGLLRGFHEALQAVIVGGDVRRFQA